MALLTKYINKKINASTLIEVMVASILIIVIFASASLLLTTLLQSNAKSNTNAIENELSRLVYLYNHQKIDASYNADFNNWHIELVKEGGGQVSFLLIARNGNTQEKIIRILENESAN